jgi:mRNA interferase MazF
VNFAPAVGSEIQKLRPGVVVNDPNIGRLPMRIVLPITDWKAHYANYAWFVYLAAAAENGLAKESGADAFQVKSVDLKRFERKIGVLTDAQMDDIAAAIAICVGFSLP